MKEYLEGKKELGTMDINTLKKGYKRANNLERGEKGELANSHNILNR